MPEPTLRSNIGLYRSGVTSPERLRHTSVAREHLIDNAIESLRGSVGRKSKNHLLFIGPRGIGKTHLLSRIEDAVQSDETLAATVIVVRFPEESNRTLSFADFLIGMCGVLKEVLEDEPLWSELHTKLWTEEDDAKVADTLVPVIREENRRHGRTLLVMLENLGEILGRQIRNKNDTASLRKFLMADNGCLLLATAPQHFDGITDIGQPFYDFFDIQMLESLSFDETVDVIRRNLEWEERTDILEFLDEIRPRLQALYRMTGGNPRLTMMLYELIAHESVTDIQNQFHLLLDRISPFYQSRLNDLPPGQRALLECLASMRDQEKTPAAIAARMRMSQQETSSLLKRLTDAHYLRTDRHPRDKRSRLYTIREGFFDIWLAINLSRGTRRRMPFLLDFFSLFHPSYEAREEKRRQLHAKLRDGGSVDAETALDYLSEVGDETERTAAKFDIARVFARRGMAEQVANYVLEAAPLAGDAVSRSIARIVTRAPPASDYLSEIEEMIAAWEMHRSGNLEKFAHRLAEIGNELTLRTFSETRLTFLRDALESVGKPEKRIVQRLRIASVLMELARWEECEEQQRHALAEAKEFADPKLVAWASNELAQLLQRTGRLGEAEPLMRRALELCESAYSAWHPTLASFLNNLATLLHVTERLEEAEPLMRRALEIDKTVFGEEHQTVAMCLSNLAQILRDTNRIEEAETLMRKALEIGEAAFGERHPNLAICKNNLAILLWDTNRTEEAETLMRRALEIDEAAFGDRHPTTASRLNHLSQMLKDTYRIGEAESLLLRALEIDVTAFGEQHPNVAVDLGNLALLLMDTNRIAEAETLMWRALEIDEAVYGEQHPKVAMDLNNLSLLLKAGKRSNEAEPLMRRSIDILNSYGRPTGPEHGLIQVENANYQTFQQATGPKEPASRSALPGGFSTAAGTGSR